VEAQPPISFLPQASRSSGRQRHVLQRNGCRRREPPFSAEGAIGLYRRILASAPDKSVTICAVGTLTALAALLRSRPDSQSALSGWKLIDEKVDRLVTMAKGS